MMGNQNLAHHPKLKQRVAILEVLDVFSHFYAIEIECKRVLDLITLPSGVAWHTPVRTCVYKIKNYNLKTREG